MHTIGRGNTTLNCADAKAFAPCRATLLDRPPGEWTIVRWAEKPVPVERSGNDSSIGEERSTPKLSIPAPKLAHLSEPILITHARKSKYILKNVPILTIPTMKPFPSIAGINLWMIELVHVDGLEN